MFEIECCKFQQREIEDKVGWMMGEYYYERGEKVTYNTLFPVHMMCCMWDSLPFMSYFISLPSIQNN